MIGKYAELKKGKLKYQGRIDLAQYYVVDHGIVDFLPSHRKQNENWDVQVRLKPHFGARNALSLHQNLVG